MLTFDKRGTGLSDPVPASELPSIEEWMDDLRTVMDESGIDRAVLVANLASSFMAMVFAATYPARVRALVMVNAYPRFTRAEDRGSRELKGVPDPMAGSRAHRWLTGIGQWCTGSDRPGRRPNGPGFSSACS